MDVVRPQVEGKHRVKSSELRMRDFLHALAKKKLQFLVILMVLVLVRYDKIFAHCEPFVGSGVIFGTPPPLTRSFFFFVRDKYHQGE